MSRKPLMIRHTHGVESIEYVHQELISHTLYMRTSLNKPVKAKFLMGSLKYKIVILTVVI